jgi:hypothetical protein
MKAFVVLGGFLGFSLVTGAGFFVGRDPAKVLLEGSIGCVIGAVLFRWLYGVLVRNVQRSIQQRRQAHAIQSAAAAAAASKGHAVAPAAKS